MKQINRFILGILTFLSLTTIVTAPDALGNTSYGNLGMLWIFTIIIPVFALILALASFILKNPIVPFMSSLFWFGSSLTTSNILIPAGVGANPLYQALGNPEWNTLYNGMGVIMFLWSMYLLINILYENGILNFLKPTGRGR
jgi:hypothetical protein